MQLNIGKMARSLDRDNECHQIREHERYRVHDVSHSV